MIVYENREIPFSFNTVKNMTFHPHLHQQIEIVYVLEGEMEVSINGQSKVLQSNELAISFPNAIHSYKTSEFSKIAILIFNIDIATDYSNLLLQHEPTTPFLQSRGIHKDIPYCMNTFQEESPKNMDIKLLRGYVSMMLGRILESLTLVETNQSINSNLTHRMLVYIMNHFQEEITLESVAKHLGASKYYLSRIFSKKIGSNFNTYINSLRVRHAQYLLSNSNKSITEIAYESGFESQRTFYRAFKQESNIIPREYRKQNS
ncbi:helix-turn-helix domain-containing protein [Evansella sp. AB-rgal1]|uniref:AraC family transcriptional regulator n=1 Tax=Evansella sp. AB-rgal1 TaxID=3242696 RepID=UPI00359DD61E